jgi:hypothetical protein
LHQGEDFDDMGTIVVEDNDVNTYVGLMDIDPPCEKEIIVIISGGTVQDIVYPEGTEDINVIVHDYDVEGADTGEWDIRKDEEGDEYQVLAFPKRSKQT